MGEFVDVKTPLQDHFGNEPIDKSLFEIKDKDLSDILNDFKL